jgi:hypothetical protein
LISTCCICGGDDLPGLHQHRALDAVLQLAHVARPLVVHQRRHGLVAQLDAGLVLLRAVQGDEVLRERRDVLGTIAQRRHEDLDDVQAEEQIRDAHHRGAGIGPIMAKLVSLAWMSIRVCDAKVLGAAVRCESDALLSTLRARGQFAKIPRISRSGRADTRPRRPGRAGPSGQVSARGGRGPLVGEPRVRLVG